MTAKAEVGTHGREMSKWSLHPTARDRKLESGRTRWNGRIPDDLLRCRCLSAFVAKRYRKGLVNSQKLHQDQTPSGTYSTIEVRRSLPSAASAREGEAACPDMEGGGFRSELEKIDRAVQDQTDLTHRPRPPPAHSKQTWEKVARPPLCPFAAFTDRLCVVLAKCAVVYSSRLSRPCRQGQVSDPQGRKAGEEEGP